MRKKKMPDPTPKSAQDHYKILQVDRKAVPEVIVAATEALSKLHANDPDPALRLAIEEAYLTLNDPAKRAEYDGAEEMQKGKIVGNYRILSKIAEGGFGTTYKAEHLTTKGPVCIKHAHHVSASDEALLLEEARLCWDLRHWGIPAVRDILKMPDDSLAIVMSYVPGPTLQQVCEKAEYANGLDAEHVAWITERILNILKYLHYNGVVHGDVKPANVIIQPESHHVTLVDYGLSALRPKQDDSAKGYTPFYASPEHEAGTPLLPESDFYGLGMTMIFALGGDIKKIRVPGDTPASMCSFIKNLIRRDPMSRPSWEKEDLCETIQQIREKDFGRKMSGMKKL